jgi:hypothetical protein
MTAESGQKSDCLRQLICPLYLSIQRANNSTASAYD